MTIRRKNHHSPPTDWRAPDQCLFVVGVHRSGSTLLCRMMGATGVLGYPDEYFKRRTQAMGADEICARLRLPVERGMSANGIAAVKVFENHFREVTETCRIEDWYPRRTFVFVQRLDKLDQAISWARARQTKQYRSFELGKSQALYSRRMIAKALTQILTIEAEWELYFARNGIGPVRVAYETFLVDPRRDLVAIAEALGKTIPAQAWAIEEAGLSMQRDETNAAWKARFIEEAQDPSLLETLSQFRMVGRSGLDRLRRAVLGEGY
jgi:trehalose 2-sulfotransferase